MRYLTLALVVLFSPLVGDGWTPELSMQTSAIHRALPSPDGSRVVVERSFDGSCGLYLGERQLVSSGFEAAWSPDGKWLAFLKRDGQLHLLPMDSGEPRQLTDGTESIQTYRWAPDSHTIAFVRREESTQGRAIVVDDPGFPRGALWRVDLEGETTRLTPPNYNVRGMSDFGNQTPDFDWSPDGGEITFAHSPTSDLNTTYSDSSLSTLDLRNGEISDWEQLYPHQAVPCYSPDGRWIAFLHGPTPHNWSMTAYAAVRCRKSGEIRDLAPTPNEGPYLGASPILGWHGDKLLFFEPSRTRFTLLALPVDGSEPELVDDGSTYFSSITLGGDKLGLVIEAPGQLPEAYVTGLDRFDPVQITSFNAWAQEIPIGPTIKVCWPSADGIEIEGLLTLPRDWDGEPLPLLLLIHGGPMAFHTEGSIARPYPYSVASFAEEGFAVLKPNPRGSCGYGRTFRTLNYRDWGGLDYLDLMSGIDALIAEGIADPDRLGVMGWSYGGYMTMWIVSQTDRFCAASAGAGISNLISFAGSHDLPSFVADYFGGETWEQRGLYLDRSPLTHIANARTPCLIQHGANDLRVPMCQSLEFYTALKRLGVEAQLVIYPDCGHGPREAAQQLDSMERNLEWFKVHCGN